jgi:hypothetical protein
MTFSDFSDLDELPAVGGNAAAKAKEDRPTFPCQSCGGSGKYRGARVHQPDDKCFPCGGRGFFYQSHGDRMKARAQAAKRKQSKLETAQELFSAENHGVADFLAANAHWSEFLRDMLTAYREKGALTEGQLRAVRSTQAKVAARDEQRRSERDVRKAAAQTPVDLSPIHAMFDKAKSAGLSKLQYRAEGLVLSLAKPNSANPGAIYVKRKNGTYLGKVVGQTFSAGQDATDDDKTALRIIADNPAEAAERYGKTTGECSCCGRELTDPASIAAGIGPVCATKWGF